MKKNRRAAAKKRLVPMIAIDSRTAEPTLNAMVDAVMRVLECTAAGDQAKIAGIGALIEAGRMGPVTIANNYMVQE